MPESATGLSAWESIYVIVGTSGGALIGIHNAWDTVTHIVTSGLRSGQAEAQ